MNLKFLKKSKEKIFLSIIGTAFLCFSPIRSEAYGLTEIFDADYYATRYEDVQAVFGNNKDALYDHFLTYGMKEGRDASPYFSVEKYKENYPDLQEAFGDDLTKYYEHFVLFGIDEQRDCGIDTDHWNDYISINSIKITCAEGVSSSYIQKTREELSKLPNEYIRKFVKDGWNIEIKSSTIVGDNGHGYAGMCYLNLNKIEVYQNAFSAAMLHEIGHFIDYRFSDEKFSSSATFVELTDKYSEEIQNLYTALWGNSTSYIAYYTNSKKELFADCIKMAYNGDGKLQEYVPDLYNYIVSLDD